MKSKEILNQLTLEEKASLCSGADFWHLKSVERLGLLPIMLTDGPHGLRKQAGNSDHLGINKSVAATCFPTASATASSFDRELLREIGVAIGEESLQEDVAVVLGPGANIKRSPLCGRNFEYISEDPYVTGELAASLIQGVQSKGIGASLKHYALNNQERLRMVSDSVADERAMREIYLAGFETAVKRAQPYTVMSAYNRVNGIYAGEHKQLLTDILREEWGFEGLVVTDWGATSDRVEGVKTGLDLEMPSSGGFNDAAIVEAVKAGKLTEEALDKVVLRVVELILKAQENKCPGFTYNQEAHHALARRAAAESTVLLQNTAAVLPLAKNKSLAVIGAFAKTPRYQGAGSSKINPHKVDSAVEEMEKQGISFTYADGYSLKPGAEPDEARIKEACEAAREADVAVIFAGLPDEYEREGFDRTTLSMPKAHNRLIAEVAEVNPNTVVVLQLGAPVVMPWKAAVKGIVLSYLGGEAGGGAAVDVLFGTVNPGGKLAETFPNSMEDVPCAKYYAGNRMNEEYRESIYVGYRFFDKAQRDVLFPFGFGLSYTSFALSNLVSGADSFRKGDRLYVSVDVENTGDCAGAEVVQFYVGREQGGIFRAEKELKGFQKVYLEPGEKKTVSIELDDRSFAYYNSKISDWAIEDGEYRILVGTSSRDIAVEVAIAVEGDGLEALLADLKSTAGAYFRLPSEGVLEIPTEDFVSVYGRPIPESPGSGKPYTVNSTLGDIRGSFIGRQLYKMVQKQAVKILSGGSAENSDTVRMMQNMMEEMPLRALVMMSNGSLDPKKLKGILRLMNGFKA